MWTVCNGLSFALFNLSNIYPGKKRFKNTKRLFDFHTATRKLYKDDNTSTSFTGQGQLITAIFK